MQWDTDPTLTTRIHLDAYAASRDGVLDSLVADGTYSLCMDRPARFVLPEAKGALVMGWSEADAEEESCWKLYEMVGAFSAHARDSTGSSSGFKELGWKPSTGACGASAAWTQSTTCCASASADGACTRASAEAWATTPS